MIGRDLQPQDFVLVEGSGRRMALIAVALGVAALGVSALLGLRGGEHAAQDFFRSYLQNFMYFLSLALGGDVLRAGHRGLVVARRADELQQGTGVPPTSIQNSQVGIALSC